MTLADQLAPLDDGMYSTPIPPEVKHALIECALALETAQWGPLPHAPTAECPWCLNARSKGHSHLCDLRRALAALEKALSGGGE